MKLKMPLFFTMLTFFLLHIAMTILYLCPPNIIKNQYEKYTSAYMNPIFSQNWHLFSPNPGLKTHHTWIKCSLDNRQWTNWQDPFARIKTEADENPMGGQTKLLYVYRYIATQYSARIGKILSGKNLDNTAIKKDQAIALSQDSVEFKDMKKLALAICKNHFDTKSNIYAQFSIIRITPKKFSERKSKSRWGSLEDYTSMIIDDKIEG